MKTTIRRWGNSLALRIPKAFAEETGVEDGAAVEITVSGGCLTVRPLGPVRYTLEELLIKVTPRSRHREADTGPPKGREAW